MKLDELRSKAKGGIGIRTQRKRKLGSHAKRLIRDLMRKGVVVLPKGVEIRPIDPEAGTWWIG